MKMLLHYRVISSIIIDLQLYDFQPHNTSEYMSVSISNKMLYYSLQYAHQYHELLKEQYYCSRA